ncbi:Ethylene-responsive transcription factor Related to AP22-12 [Forsythia ovata]|uniref:Ethylene-responsive transcription factor Related to AP22-12 n=1 Tax=Forsythia ovata TaxID=205694 RepID=A0ABD1Q3E4_9LAMI
MVNFLEDALVSASKHAGKVNLREGLPKESSDYVQPSVNQNDYYSFGFLEEKSPTNQYGNADVYPSNKTKAPESTTQILNCGENVGECEALVALLTRRSEGEKTTAFHRR